ncbi:GAS2-like protein 2 [Scleropages formosus]|nr:GAS2-like protein 2 [Scleropages formosus]
MSTIEEATSRSIKPFRSSEEYLFAMKEDLAEWLRELYGISVWSHTFAEALETGSVLCQHANEVTRAARRFLQEHGTAQGPYMKLPAREVTFNHAAPRASFAARDNVSNFISWCRTEMGIADVLMFETEDLVLRKNEKNFVLCLLEVARRASRFGMAAPLLIRMEEEIEQEIHEDLHVPDEGKALPGAQRWASDFENLDEMVQHLVSRCTCPTQFPMVKVSEGKYRVGDSSTLIFVRILRNHVMVRVGGGWDTLEHYLDKHDPCRCTSLSHKQSRSGLQHPAAPVHGVMARVGQNGTQTTLLVSRLQSPPPPVCWSSSGPTQSVKPGSTSASLRHASSPEPGSRANMEPRPPTPSRARERTAMLSGRQPPSDSWEDSMRRASTRTGREATRQGPSPRMARSLPRPTESSSVSQPEVHRPKTPLMLQRNTLPPFLHPVQHSLDPRLTQTWRKSQFASKQKQSAAQNMEAQNGVANPVSVQSQGGLFSARSSTPVRCYVPTQNIHQNSRTLDKTIQPTEGAGSSLQTLDFIRTFSPTRQVRNEALDHHNASTFSKCTPKDCLVDQTVRWMSTPFNYQTTSKNISKEMRKDGLSSSAQDALSFPVEHGNAIDSEIFCQSVTDPSHSHIQHQDFKQLHNKGKEEDDRQENRRYAFTPQPISPAQEASLYRSLEHEILANLQLLDTDLDDSSSEEDPEDGGSAEKVTTVSRRVPLPRPHDAGLPSSGSTAQVGASSTLDSGGNVYGAVVAELLEGKSVLRSVDMESWVAKLPSKSGDRIQVQDAEVNAGWVKGSKPSTSSSWSSLASSVKSDDFQDPKKCRSDAADARLEAPEAPASLTGMIQGPGKEGNPSFKQNRTLKKPERVPSIYKLKLRPRVRPRCDHRPEKKPSKIPTPLFYRRGQSGRNSQRDRRRGAPVAPLACWESPDSQKDVEPPLKSPVTRVFRVKRATEEMQRDQEQESWV